MRKIRKTKMVVHSIEESKKVQDKLFELGCRWHSSGKEYANLKDRYLFVDEDLYIYTSTKNKRHFDAEKGFTEIYAEDLLNLEKPKFSGFELKCTAEMRKAMFGDSEDYIVKYTKSLVEQELYERGVRNDE